jgi:hypothetical protein
LISITFILFSFLLVFFGIDKQLLDFFSNFGPLSASFFGLFYTFGATTPISIVVILELMIKENSPFLFATLASLSATAVDCIFFTILKNSLEKNAKNLKDYFYKKFGKFNGLLKISGFLAFGLPVPDEIALALLQMTDIKIGRLAIVIFFSKFFTLLLFWYGLVH